MNESDKSEQQMNIQFTTPYKAISSSHRFDFSNLNNSATRFVDLNFTEKNDFTIKNTQLTGISLELKNSVNWNMPKETIYPSYVSKINNMDLAVIYKISDDLSVGADFRHETFFVKYRGMNSYNQTVDYEQNPNLYSYGIFARYKLTEFLGLNPFAQGMFSANNYGLIYRGSIGLEYSLLPEFGLMAQAEYSNINFKHQNNSFNAGKFSIVYGIKYSF